jgi:hypothetical protein
MRTKVLATIAALAVTAFVAQAQVYSENIVGYVNVDIEPGSTLLANPLNATPDNTLDNVLPNVPDETTLFKWNFAGQTFAASDTFFAGFGWFDSGFNPSTTTIDPGEGFFLKTAASVTTTNTITFVGEVSKGTNTVVVQGPGNNFLGNPIPVAESLVTAGLSVADESTYRTFNTAANSYDQALTYFAGFGWFDAGFNPADPVPNVAQGFVIDNKGATTNWTQVFNP